MNNSVITSKTIKIMKKYFCEKKANECLQSRIIELRLIVVSDI